MAAALGDSYFIGDALALMVAIYRDCRQPMPLSLDAAKSARSSPGGF
jgi:hypothetical protein